MIYTALIFVTITLAWIIVAKYYFRHTFTHTETGIQVLVSCIFIFALFYGSRFYQTHDTMLVNGFVTSKEARQESCPGGWNDYQDDFCTEYTTRSVFSHQTCETTNNQRVCTDHYKTQYNYIYDWERRYFVYTNLEDVTYEISRIDRQGAMTPERFEIVEKDDPVVTEVSYRNFIQAASYSLLNQKFEEVAEIAYPSVYDYYNARRVIVTNYPADPQLISDWNQNLAEINSKLSDLGANVIVNVTGHDQIWSEQLRQAWDAHNINDVIVNIGMDGDEISWVKVDSWSKNEITNIQIRDAIMNISRLEDFTNVFEFSDRINLAILANILLTYEMRSMSEFEYLLDDITLPMWVIILASIFSLVVTPLVSYAFHRNEIA